MEMVLMKERKLTLQDILDAKERIKPYTIHTPLLREPTMDTALGCQVYLKPEMLQVSGAFKMRGAANRVMALTEEERKRGIVCTSSGNHGNACALIGQLSGTPVTVVLPEDVPAIKREGAKKKGANVILTDRKFALRWAKVQELARTEGYTIVHAYEDYEVMAGQGTIGLEILEDLPDVDTIITPIGGGGLISGIGTAVKALKPEVKIVGVQARGQDAYAASWRAGAPVRVETTPTIADGIHCGVTGEPNYSIIRQVVDLCISVEEEDIRKAMRLVAQEAKLFAEPSSCVVIAALLGGAYKARPGEKIAFVLTAGNWDPENFGKIMRDEHVPGVL